LVTPGAKNAKFSPGGLVDIEYTTQALQIRHGLAHPEVREVSTRRAIRALESVGALDPPVAKLLRESYEFFRRLIDALRMVRGNARDLTVPSLGSDEFLLLGRRLGYADRALRERLVLHLHGYLEVVQGLSAELLP
jgi:glutamate-ammonia-ligase adenylyltransferase